jgi:CHAD domain-containing protein
LKPRADARRPQLAGLFIRRAIAASVRRLLDHETRAIAGRGTEAVHQARVAVRRLRSDLRTFRELVDARWAGRLRQELRWLGGELGAVRDYDVFISRLRAAAARSGAAADPSIAILVAAARAARSKARAHMADALRTPRFARLRERLALAARAPRLTLAARLAASQAFPRIIKRRRKRIMRAVRDLTTRPSLASLHRIRILAKRLRYAAEAIEGAGCTGAAALARAAEGVQGVLGELNDAASSCAALRRLRTKPGLALAANAMLALEMEAVVRAREAWPASWGRLAVAELPTWR